MRLNIRAGDTYNIDKTSIALGVYINIRVLIKVDIKKTYIKFLENYK